MVSVDPQYYRNPPGVDGEPVILTRTVPRLLSELLGIPVRALTHANRLG
jgi:hypothetical protein